MKTRIGSLVVLIFTLWVPRVDAAVRNEPPEGGGKLYTLTPTPESAENLAEALKNLPRPPEGREAACRQIAGRLTAFSLRGLPPEHSLILINGKPLVVRGSLLLEEPPPVDVAGPEIPKGDPPKKEGEQVGWKVVEAPVGRGQREIIIGDRSIGKTTVAIDTFLSRREGETEELGDDDFMLATLGDAAERIKAIETLRRQLREEVLRIIEETKGKEDLGEVAARCRQLNQITVAQRGVLERLSRYYVSLDRHIKTLDHIPLHSDIPASFPEQLSQIRTAQRHLAELLASADKR